MLAEELKLIKASKCTDYLHANNLEPEGSSHWRDDGMVPDHAGL
ncbi:hypothetical protein [Methylocystis echinoides]|nr:hypothetical protein [Methylocystis echinoides]